MGKCITKNELKDIIIVNNSSYVSKLSVNDYIGTIAEIFGHALRKNPECTYEEMKASLKSYEQSAFAKLPQFDNEEFFERFQDIYRQHFSIAVIIFPLKQLYTI